jgi:ribonuclease P protein component
MIHSTHRFHGRSSLRFVYQHGRQMRGEFVSVRIVRNARRHTWRAAVVVSRKVSKSAVVRNRIRRRIFEMVRTNSGRIAMPYDIVFTVFSEHVATMDSTDLRRCVLDPLEKGGVFKDATGMSDHGIVKRKETP